MTENNQVKYIEYPDRIVVEGLDFGLYDEAVPPMENTKTIINDSGNDLQINTCLTSFEILKVIKKKTENGFRFENVTSEVSRRLALIGLQVVDGCLYSYENQMENWLLITERVGVICEDDEVDY